MCSVRNVSGVCCMWTIGFTVVRSFFCIYVYMVYTISEKMMRSAVGASFDISRYVEGKDYVRRRCFRGERLVFRKGILSGVQQENAIEDAEIDQEEAGNCEAARDMVEQVEPVLEKKEEQEQVEYEPIPVVETVVSVKQEVQDGERPVEVAGSGSYECVVTRLYPNTRYVETDKGRVFAGGKGSLLKRNQRILVRDGVMILNKVKKIS